MLAYITPTAAYCHLSLHHQDICYENLTHLTNMGNESGAYQHLGVLKNYHVLGLGYLSRALVVLSLSLLGYLLRAQHIGLPLFMEGNNNYSTCSFIAMHILYIMIYCKIDKIVIYSQNKLLTKNHSSLYRKSKCKLDFTPIKSVNEHLNCNNPFSSRAP